MTETLAYGSLDEAETAYLMNAYNRILDGWEYLGSGVHRTAYLSPSRVVYKVAHAGYAARQAQFAEMLAVNVLSSGPIPEGFGVPAADLVEVVPEVPVIAMEYIDGEGCYLDGDTYNTARIFYRNSDIHAGNVLERRSDGTIFMIDLGFFDENDVNGSSASDICSCCRPCPQCGEAGCNERCADLCGNCGWETEECHCCDICMGDIDWCNCCRDCNENEENCCCAFCQTCTKHLDDCDPNNCVTPF